MNKKIFFAIFLMFLIGLSTINTVQATDNDNVFTSFSSWIASLFSKQKIQFKTNSQADTPQQPEISDSPAELNNYPSELSQEPSELDDQPSELADEFIVLTPKQGPAGTEVTINGYNFPPNEFITNLQFGDSMVIPIVVGGPNFRATFTVPEVPEGTYLVSFEDFSDAYDYFTVTESSPDQYITVNPEQGYVGDDIAINGYGFKDNEEGIIIRFDDMFLGYVDADSNGEFTFNTEVPMVNDDQLNYLIEAVDSDGYIVSTNFVILWDEQPTIVAIPDEGYVEDEFVVNGYNFPENENGIMITFDDILLGYVDADSNGEFTFNTEVPMPNDDQLYYVIEAVGPGGYVPATDKFTILWGEELTLIATPDEGYVNDVIDLEGTGYAPGEELDIYMTAFENFSDTTLIAEVTVLDDGTFDTTFVVPDMSFGTHNILVFGDEMSSWYDIYEEFTILEEQGSNLTLIATPDEGYVNDVIYLEGTGYVPNDNLVIVFDNTEIIANVQADDEGSFSTTFNVPDMEAGDYLINVYGENMSSLYDIYEEFTILEEQGSNLTLIATPDEGYVNDVIDLEGTGYIPGDSVTIYFDNEVLMTTSMGMNGTFDTTFVVPDMEAGDYLITVYSNDMSAFYDVEEIFTILDNGTQPDNSEIFVDPEQGYVDDVIDLWGNNFDANDTLVISMAGQTIATPTTDNDGSFTTTFNVPDVPAGPYTITVQEYDAEADFEVLEQGSGDEEIFVSPNSGYSGDVIDVWGNNFGANENLTLYLGPEFIVNVNTDNTGSFTGVFTVPDMEAGLYDVMVVGYSATAPFIVLEEGEEPDLFVSPDNGVPGDIIDLIGINFGENETLVIYLDGQVIATPTTDMNGAFFTTFVVPEWAAGDYEITVFSYNVSEWFTINDWEEEEEEEEEEEDDDDDDDIERKEHNYYMEGLTCDSDVHAGDKAKLSFEVVNIGITDEDNMIVEVDCDALGVHVLMEDVLIERLEPNLMEIPLDIPEDAEEGSYSCMVEIYPDYYAYDEMEKVTDSINLVIGEPVEYTDTEVIYVEPKEEEEQEPADLNVSLFLLNLALLGIIVVFVVLTIRSIRK
jgi:hypothetical protein